MPLVIGQLVTHCRLPERLRPVYSLVDHFAREQFATELAEFLGPSLDRHPGVVRIRRLQLRVRISAAQLREGNLARIWLQAFGRELFSALAYASEGAPIEVARADDRPSFVAEAFRDMQAGRSDRLWRYEEFGQLSRLSRREAAMTLLTHEPEILGAVLTQLASQGELESLLAHLDDLALERLFVLLAQFQPTPETLTLDQLLGIARLTATDLPGALRAGFATRRHALLLWTDRKAANWYPGTPRMILQALTILKILLAPASAGEKVRNDGRLPLSPAGVELLRAIEAQRELIELQQTWAPAGANGPPDALAELEALLKELLPVAPVPAAVAKHAPSWIASDFAGIFLLGSLIRKFGLPQNFSNLPQAASAGERALAYILTGLSLAAVGMLDRKIERLDPGLALFAGILGEPDLAGIRGFLAGGSAQERSALLTALELDPAGNPAASWIATLEQIADHLVTAFAARVRGFRRSNRESIARQFLAKTGRILVEEDTIHVALNSSPFHIALHISSLDESYQAEWIGGRKVNIYLEGI